MKPAADSFWAMYHFFSGYTARVAGTERGVSEPKLDLPPKGANREQIWGHWDRWGWRLLPKCWTIPAASLQGKVSRAVRRERRARLRYGLGCSTAEAAERTGYRQSSIRKVTHRRLAALSDRLIGARFQPEQDPEAAVTAITAAGTLKDD